ncbi:MAG: MotA/TolQ/ExbB proton channel family protein [Myxococcota bacterium]|nr:MotA/TolQ/ExbB proton channel family protein [Myxococcota bacterium]
MTLTERLLEVANIGAEWVLWVLVALSVLSVAAIIERIVFFLRFKERPELLQASLRRSLERGEVEEARKALAERRSMEARVLSAGLGGANMGPTSAGELMNGALAMEKVRYERNLGFLATVGSNTPFIGLFGTVLGIVNAFAALDLAGGGNVNDKVMVAIAEALVATGVGLLVAIPAVVAYNSFKVMVKRSVARTDSVARTLLAHLSAEGQVEVASNAEASKED